MIVVDFENSQKIGGGGLKRDRGRDEDSNESYKRQSLNQSNQSTTIPFNLEQMQQNARKTNPEETRMRASRLQKLGGLQGSRKIEFNYWDNKIWLTERGVNNFSNIEEYIMPCSNETGQECGWYLVDDQIKNIRNYDSYKIPEYLKIKLDWEETPNEIILKSINNYPSYYFGEEINELYETEDGKRLLKKIQDRITDVMYEFQDWKGIIPETIDRDYIDLYFGEIRRGGLKINRDIFWQIHLHSIYKKHMKYREMAEEASLNTFYSNVPGGVSDPIREYLDSDSASQNTQNKKRKLGE